MIRITDAEARRALRLIREAKLVEGLQQAINADPRGRKPRLPLEPYLVGAYLAASNGHFKSTVIFELLTKGLSVPRQLELGVLQRVDGEFDTCTVEHVNYYAKMFTRCLSYTPAAAKHNKLTIDDAEMERRRTALEAALNALLDASIAGKTTGHYALDGSNYWSWVRAAGRVHDDDVREKEADADFDRVSDKVLDDPEQGANQAHWPELEEAPPTHDPDAAMGSKTAKSGGREPFFGYILDAAIRVAKPGGPKTPMVVERIIVSPASTDVVQPTLSILDGLLQRGPVTDIYVDRHYSYKSVHRWADELRGRGISQHFDLRKDEHGFRDVDGHRVVAGWAHCPATPDDLATIERPNFNGNKQQREEFHARITERFSWAMDRKERPNANGRTRWICPAVNGKRTCALRPESDLVPDSELLPRVANPPDLATAPSCCTNASGVSSLSADILRKHDQPNYWGTQTWAEAYNQRTYVEGMFGSIKSADTENLRRGFTRFAGLPLVTLGVTLAAAAANIRHQTKFWEERLDRPDHWLLQPLVEPIGFAETTAGERDAIADRFYEDQAGEAAA